MSRKSIANVSPNRQSCQTPDPTACGDPDAPSPGTQPPGSKDFASAASFVYPPAVAGAC
jgi:hypothetical protein